MLCALAILTTAVTAPLYRAIYNRTRVLPSREDVQLVRNDIDPSAIPA
jgi:hypothetical protein